MAELSVELTGSVKKLEDALKKGQKALVKTGEVAESASSKVSKSTATSSKGLNSLNKSTANVTPTLLEFNRTIQDAPFGIQGVANNIQQLTANFGHLSKQSGGAGNALKALLGGFLGPQGILFAVSAVTALLVTYGDELFKSTSLTKKLAKATAEFIGTAETEIAVLKNLVSIAQDENLSKKVRLGALDEINGKYGDYLGNLSLEEIGTDAVRASVDALTKSLLKQAQVKGIESAISNIYGEAGEELAELLINQKNARKAIKRELDELRGVEAFSRVDGDLPLTQQIREIEAIVNRNKGAGGKLLTGLGLANQDFNDASESAREFRKELEEQIAPFQDILKDFTIDDLFNQLSEIGEGVTVTAPKLKFSKGSNDIDPVYSQDELENIFGISDKALGKLEEQGNKLAKVVGNNFSKAADFSRPGLARIEQALIDFNDNASQIINNSIASTFVALGTGIGAALAGAGNIFDNIGNALLSSLGGILVKLGELAIETGVGLLAVQIALKSLNPYVAIAAGVALVAIGSAFSTKASGLAGGSGGFSSGSVSGQGSSGSFSTGGSFSGGGFGSGGTVVFEIAGTKLLGVLENTRTANQRIGGNVGG